MNNFDFTEEELRKMEEDGREIMRRNAEVANSTEYELWNRPTKLQEVVVQVSTDMLVDEFTTRVQSGIIGHEFSNDCLMTDEVTAFKDDGDDVVDIMFTVVDFGDKYHNIELSDKNLIRDIPITDNDEDETVEEYFKPDEIGTQGTISSGA